MIEYNWYCPSSYANYHPTRNQIFPYVLPYLNNIVAHTSVYNSSLALITEEELVIKSLSELSISSLCGLVGYDGGLISTYMTYPL